MLNLLVFILSAYGHLVSWSATYLSSSIIILYLSSSIARMPLTPSCVSVFTFHVPNQKFLILSQIANENLPPLVPFFCPISEANFRWWLVTVWFLQDGLLAQLLISNLEAQGIFSVAPTSRRLVWQGRL